MHRRPIANPLRRVPIHKQKIVRKLLQKYEELGLIEKIDSPFRASTVLVAKKNVAEGADVTDQKFKTQQFWMANTFT